MILITYLYLENYLRYTIINVLDISIDMICIWNDISEIGFYFCTQVKRKKKSFYVGSTLSPDIRGNTSHDAYKTSTAETIRGS
jgi:hypothetical protein